MKQLIFLILTIPCLCFGDAGIMGDLANIPAVSVGCETLIDSQTGTNNANEIYNQSKLAFAVTALSGDSVCKITFRPTVGGVNDDGNVELRIGTSWDLTSPTETKVISITTSQSDTDIDILLDTPVTGQTTWYVALESDESLYANRLVMFAYFQGGNTNQRRIAAGSSSWDFSGQPDDSGFEPYFKAYKE